MNNLIVNVAGSSVFDIAKVLLPPVESSWMNGVMTQFASAFEHAKSGEQAEVVAVHYSRRAMAELSAGAANFGVLPRYTAELDEVAGKVNVRNFDGMTPHTAARMLDRLDVRRALSRQATAVNGTAGFGWAALSSGASGIDEVAGHFDPTSPFGAGREIRYIADSEQDGSLGARTSDETEGTVTAEVLPAFEEYSAKSKSKNKAAKNNSGTPKPPATYPWKSGQRLPVDKFPLPEEGEPLYEEYLKQKEYRQNYWIDTGIPPYGKQIHHAVEQEIWEILDGVFDASEKNKTWNLRGIWGSDADALHQSSLRIVWNMIYRRLRLLGILPPLSDGKTKLSGPDAQRAREALIFWAMVVDLLFGLRMYPHPSIVDDPDFLRFLYELGLTPEQVAALADLIKNEKYPDIQKILAWLLAQWNGKSNPFRKFMPSVRPTMPRYSPTVKPDGNDPRYWDEDDDEVWEREYRRIPDRQNADYVKVGSSSGARGARTAPPSRQLPAVPSEAPPVPAPEIAPSPLPVELPSTGNEADPGQPAQPEWQPRQQPGSLPEQQPEPRPQENPAPPEPPRPVLPGEPDGYGWYSNGNGGFKLMPLNPGNPYTYPDLHDLPDPPLGQGWIFDGQYMQMIPLPPDLWYDPKYKTNMLPPIPQDTHWEPDYGEDANGDKVLPEFHVVPNKGVHPLHGERQWYPQFEPPPGWKWESNGKGGWYLRTKPKPELSGPAPRSDNGKSGPRLDYHERILPYLLPFVPIPGRIPGRLLIPGSMRETPRTEIAPPVTTPELPSIPDPVPSVPATPAPRWSPPASSAPAPAPAPAPSQPSAPAPAPAPSQPNQRRRPNPEELV